MVFFFTKNTIYAILVASLFFSSFIHLYVYEQLEFSPPFITEGKMTKLIESPANKADFYFLNEIFNASLPCNYALVTPGPLFFEGICSNFLVLFSLAHYRFCDTFYINYV